MITTLIATYFVPVLLEELCFLGNNNILSTGLLVSVVDDENVH
jgi:hypothetical protein